MSQPAHPRPVVAEYRSEAYLRLNNPSKFLPDEKVAYYWLEAQEFLQDVIVLLRFV